MPAHVIIFVASLNEISPLRKEIESREIGVNGRTDGRTDGRATRKHNAVRLLLLAKT